MPIWSRCAGRTGGLSAQFVISPTHATLRNSVGSFFGKVAVMGLLQRKTEGRSSRVRTMVVPNVRKHQLEAQVAKHVEDRATVYTDALMSYRNLDMYYQHKVIDHAEKYVDGQVHTNGCENYWSLLKRALGGTYVSVEPFHLFRYLDEQAFRFNERAG